MFLECTILDGDFELGIVGWNRWPDIRRPQICNATCKIILAEVSQGGCSGKERGAAKIKQHLPKFLGTRAGRVARLCFLTMIFLAAVIKIDSKTRFSLYEASRGRISKNKKLYFIANSLFSRTSRVFTSATLLDIQPEKS